MSRIDYRFAPLETWPGEKTKNRKRAPFRASMTHTHELLARELTHLQARNVAIQADCERSEIRIDGMLRADARLKSPCVILSFDSKLGPLQYPCDTYLDWRDNLRAIGLALAALRAVDRYGVTRRAEQYRGWQQLPAPAADGFSGKEAAAKFISALVGLAEGAWRKLTIDTAHAASMVRVAEFKTHPDVGGDPEQFKRVQKAKEALLG